MKPKLIIATTIPLSLIFYKGQIQVLKEEFDVVVCSSSGERLNDFTKMEDVRSIAVDMSREISLFKDLKSLWRLIKQLRIEEPEIILSSTPKAGLLCSLASWITRVPYRIYYLHGLRYDGLSGLKKTLVKWLEGLTCRLSTNIFAVSNGVKDRLKTDNITSKDVHLIHHGSANGIDLDYFSRSQTNKIKINNEMQLSDYFVFGFVGRLVKDKGINELVNAFLEINKKHPMTKLLLVGDFEFQIDSLDQETITHIQEHKDILAVGFQKDIRPWLLQMDIFVFPSYREGFGVSVMEAMAMGVPVIVSNITGCNELVNHRKNGLLFEPRSKRSLERAMNDCLKSNKELNDYARNALENIKIKYKQEDVWSETLKAYTKIINSDVVI